VRRDAPTPSIATLAGILLSGMIQAEIFSPKKPQNQSLTDPSVTAQKVIIDAIYKRI